MPFIDSINKYRFVLPVPACEMLADTGGGEGLVRDPERVMTLAANRSLARWPAISSAMLLAYGFLGIAAHAAGKPEKAYLESKVHLIWQGLYTSKLSRFDAQQNHLEHARDARTLPGLLRRTQSNPLPFYDQRSVFDVVTEYWCEDFGGIRDMFTEEGRRSAQRSWMSRFAGGPAVGAQAWRPGGAAGLIVQDHVLVDGAEQGYKWFSFLRRKEGISKEQVDAYVRETYGPALAKLPGIRRYVVGISYQPKGEQGFWGRAPAWDAVDMIWFDDLDAMRRLLGSIDYQENVQRAAELAVIDQSKTVSFAATHHETLSFPPRYEGPRWEEPVATSNP